MSRRRVNLRNNYVRRVRNFDEIGIRDYMAFKNRSVSRNNFYRSGFYVLFVICIIDNWDWVKNIVNYF